MIQNILRLASLTILLLCSCTRTTMVSGRITNIRTGNPVAGMPVTLHVYNGHEPRDSSNPKKVGQSSTHTNSNGEYALECSGVGIDDASLELDNGNFCYAYFMAFLSDQVKPNASREVNIEIDSVDGRLHLILQNQTGQFEQLFVKVDCDATGDKGNYCCSNKFKYALVAGASDTLQFLVSAGRYVPFYWGTSEFTAWNSPNVDSVFCPRGVTTTFTLSF